MTLCCKMDDAIHMFILHQFEHTFKVTDIHLDKLVIRFVLNILEVCQVTCISEFIQIDNSVLWIFVNKQANYVATDKTSTTSNNYIAFHIKHVLKCSN